MWTYSAVVAALLAMSGGLSSRPAAHNRISQVTWTTDIEPMLKTRCVGCHRTDGFGPMSLATYDEAKRSAKAIREEVLERRMPPWPAARGFGEFVNDRSLTPLEIDLLAAWADGGTPIGPPVAAAHNGAVRPVDRPPDLVLTVPAHAVDALNETFELPTGLVDRRWIAGWEFRPGNRSIVEQAVLRIVPATLVAAWTPPEGPVMYPAGVAQRLPAGSRLVLELRYRKSATPQIDWSGVALYFRSRPAREVYHQSLRCGMTSIDRDVDVFAITPRPLAAGESLEIVARRPDQSVEPLCVVPRYAPEYPLTYRFRKSVRLDRGTVVHLRSSSPVCGADLDLARAQ